MPELPEVETIRRDFAGSSLMGQRFEEPRRYWPKVLGSCDLKGRRILDTSRRGKYLILHLDEGMLIFHFRMTGKLLLNEGPYTRASFPMEDGQIFFFDDQRKFGRIWFSKVFEPELGPEPFDLTVENFNLNSSRPIKSVLLDQKVVAGLGNIYVDEALFHALIHPEMPANRLKEKEGLIEGIKEVIARGIENRGTTLAGHRGNYFSLSEERGRNVHALRVYLQEGKPCLRCGELVEKFRIGGRGTHFCPNCQKI